MPIKVKPEHVQTLREAMAPFLNKATAKAYKDAGLSHKRYRWDAFWLANRDHPDIYPIVQEVYKTCDDTHLDSVFRMLAKERENVEIALSIPE